MDMEVSDILKKRRISLVLESGERLFEQSFSSRKKGQGSVCSDILEQLNKYIPYEYFKMENLHYLKFVLQQGDYMCKLHLKNAYFSIPLY